MPNSRILGAAALASASIAFALLPSAALAGPPAPPPGPGGTGAPPRKTLFVNHTTTLPTAAAPAGTAQPNPNSCSNAQFSTVQSAVDAAKPGQTVYLCGTAPYMESVLVQKNLTLTGDPGAAIEAPANSRVPGTFFSSQSLQTPNSVLTVIGNVNVQVNGL